MHVAATTNPELTEEDAARQAPVVRAELFRRYEDMYSLIQQQIHRQEEVGRPVDPRWVELGVRVNKEIAVLFKLARPTPVAEEQVPVHVNVDAIELELRVLERRNKGADAGMTPAH